MRTLIIALALVAWLGSSAARAQDKPATASLERGKQLYTDLGCHACHGTHGQGGDRGAGPKIYPNPFPLAAFQYQMRKPRLDMPAYIEKWVSDQDVADMYAYLLSLKPAPAAKDIPLLNR